jgi:hypothetical protein
MLLGAHLLLAMKASMSPFLYKGRQALEWCVSISYPPYNARCQLGQNNGGVRYCSVVTISFRFQTRPSKIIVVTNYNSYKG